MKINLDQKTKIIVAVSVVTFITIISVLFSTTNLFKGSTIEGGMTGTEHSDVTSSADLVKLVNKTNTRFNGLAELFDTVISLTETSGADGYSDLDSVLASLADISSTMDEIEADLVDIDPSTFESLTDEDRSALAQLLSEFSAEIQSLGNQVASYEIELQAYLDTVVLCPIDEGETNAVTFKSNYNFFVALIESFNEKDFFVESDQQDLIDFIVAISTTNNAVSQSGCLDFSSNTPEEIVEEEQIVIDALADKTLTEIINFGNTAIENFNDNVVSCYIDNGCDSLILINNNIDAKVICSEDQEFDPETGTCVGAICPSDELMVHLDNLYLVLANYEQSPDEFDIDLFDAAYTELIVHRGSGLQGFDPTTFDYEADANTLIGLMNNVITEESNERCTQEYFDQLSIIGTEIDEQEDGEGDEATSNLQCDIDALFVTDLGVCVCPSEDIVAPGDVCPDSSAETDTESPLDSQENDEGTDEEDEESVFICDDGLIVISEDECEIPEESSEEEQNEEQEEEIVENEDNQQELPEDESLFGSQLDNLSLESNTDSNVLNSPVIQGETGAEAIAVIMVLVIGLFNVIIWVK
jgi:hypothetical protein